MSENHFKLHEEDDEPYLRIGRRMGWDLLGICESDVHLAEYDLMRSSRLSSSAPSFACVSLCVFCAGASILRGQKTLYVSRRKIKLDFDFVRRPLESLPGPPRRPRARPPGQLRLKVGDEPGTPLEGTGISNQETRTSHVQCTPKACGQPLLPPHNRFWY